MNPLKALVELEKNEAAAKGLEYTPGEILNQAAYWQDTFERVRSLGPRLRELIRAAGCTHRGLGRVIFAGAGSSHFVGLTLENLFRQKWEVDANAYATTDILTHPRSFFYGDRSVLLVSFARSGNSPESVATYDLANQLAEKVYHIVITCNEEGALASRAGKDENAAVVTLHPKTNDLGLAMTGSVSNMLVAGQALAYLEDSEKYGSFLDGLLAMASKQVEQGAQVAATLAKVPFQRAVFLGSSTLRGVATESALKLQELTDGTVMTAPDSFAGLRHGPEAIINKETAVIYYLSRDPYARRYELDLIEQIRAKGLSGPIVAVGPALSDVKHLVDFVVELPPESGVPDDLLGPAAVMFGQMLGLFKALNVGTKPDNPSVRGAISRVVKGVTIYPFPGN